MRRASLILLLLGVAANTGWSGTLGLWKESPLYVSEGLLRTLKQAGWDTVILERADLADGTKLEGLDVIFLPGGWNAYAFAGFKARRNLARFVASGKGIFTGYARTANRPLFPQVGASAHLVRAAVISPDGESELAKVIERPINTAGQFDDDIKRPSHVLEGPATKAEASFKLPPDQAAEPHELVLSARLGPKPSVVMISLNGKKLFEGQKPLTEMEWGTVRARLPKGALKTDKADNQLVIETKDAPAPGGEMDLDNIGGADSDEKSISLRIQYAVIRGQPPAPKP